MIEWKNARMYVCSCELLLTLLLFTGSVLYRFLQRFFVKEENNFVIWKSENPNQISFRASFAKRICNQKIPEPKNDGSIVE